MRILVLDDDRYRLKIFNQKLSKDNDVDLVETANDAIEKLEKNNYECVTLDHDLGGKQMEWDEENCGMNVVDWMIKNNYNKELVIYVHSYNYPRGVEMVARLNDAGYKVYHTPGLWNNLK